MGILISLFNSIASLRESLKFKILHQVIRVQLTRDIESLQVSQDLRRGSRNVIKPGKEAKSGADAR